MRRLAIGLLGIALLAGVVTLWHIVRPDPDPSAWALYSDHDFGWSLTYPVRFQLQPFHEQGRVTEDGFLVSNVTLADPLRVRTLSLPPAAVAFRLVHMVGGPAPDPDPEAVADTRLPLPQVRFFPRGKLAHRTFPVIGNGVAFRCDVWIGPDASKADRGTIARIVRSLRFANAPTVPSGP